MSAFDTVVGIANIVGAIAGIIGAIFAGVAVLPRARMKGSPKKPAQVVFPQEDPSQTTRRKAPPMDPGLSGAITFLIQEEWRRTIIVFWGDNLSDEGIYQHFKVTIIYSIICFVFSLFNGYTALTQSTGLGGILSLISLLLLCTGFGAGYFGFARFRRRFGR